MDLDKINAEKAWMNGNHITLNLSMTRSIEDDLSIQYYNGPDAQGLSDFVTNSLDGAKSQVERAENQGYVGTDQLSNKVVAGGHSVYHQLISANSTVTRWSLSIDPGSSIHPGLVLCTDGIDDQFNLELLYSTIDEEAKIHNEQILEDIKSQMSTMKL